MTTGQLAYLSTLSAGRASQVNRRPGPLQFTSNRRRALMSFPYVVHSEGRQMTPPNPPDSWSEPTPEDEAAAKAWEPKKKKRRRRWPWIVGGILLFLLLLVLLAPTI